MKTRELGRTGRDVGAIGLGCMGMSWAYGDADDTESIAVLRSALDAGVTFLDTSDMYGMGANETLVGRGLAGRFDEVVLATKVGLIAESVGVVRRDGSPEHVREGVDASLRRLGTDVIDLYYLHRTDPEVPLSETWGAMAELVEAGKVRYLGLSEVSVQQADEARAVHPVTAIQSELSLWTRDALGVPSSGALADPGRAGSLNPGNLVAWCAENGAAFVPFSPLGRGFLTGAFDAATTFGDEDFRSHNPRFASEAMAANMRLVEEVRAVAGRYDTTPARVALAWTLAQGEHVIPIPGTKRETYLRDNIGAADLELDAADLDRLTKLPPAAGSRY